MARSNVLLVLVLIFMLVMALNPQARGQALHAWEALKPIFAGIQEGLTVIINEISNNTASDAPSDDRPPLNTGPVYNL
jgi:hypothetical protein